MGEGGGECKANKIMATTPGSCRNYNFKNLINHDKKMLFRDIILYVVLFYDVFILPLVTTLCKKFLSNTTR